MRRRWLLLGVYVVFTSQSLYLVFQKGFKQLKIPHQAATMWNIGYCKRRMGITEERNGRLFGKQANPID
jgi:hypothetical protein